MALRSPASLSSPALVWAWSSPVGDPALEHGDEAAAGAPIDFLIGALGNPIVEQAADCLDEIGWRARNQQVRDPRMDHGSARGIGERQEALEALVHRTVAAGAAQHGDERLDVTDSS